VAEILTVIPSAARLMESLRDIGYELPAAIADLVDNSIEAGATEVSVDVAFEGEASWIRVVDNGSGMPAGRMNEAMRYGSERDYSATDLGKFGLGLKTASLSQCKRLTVATRTNPERREIEIRRWDTEHVRQQDRWELIRLSRGEVGSEVVDPLDQGVGTVVMWEGLDRVLGYKLPEGVAAEHGFARLCRDIEEHLAMVFHRFLTGEAHRALPFTLRLNGNAIEAWDPFARSEPKTQRLTRKPLTVRAGGHNHQIAVQPYVLPNQMQFSTAHAWERASGPEKWNRQQGLYIYRGDRMIQSGGWNRLRTLDEHTKLARVAMDIPRSADSAFEINVSKMRVTIPADIREELRTIVSDVARGAQVAYRQSDTAKKGLHGTPGSAIGVADSDGASRYGGRDGGSSHAMRRSSTSAGVRWSTVETVLRRELAGHERLLRRIMIALRKVGIPPEEDDAKSA
jgi:hypothetical protein